MTKKIQWYVDQGFSLFPLPYRSKKPFAKWNWKVLQRRKPTQEELEAWFSGSRFNVAVVTGSVSENLAVLDFDVPELFDSWYYHTVNLPAPVVRTGNGFHVYVKILGPTSLRNGNFQVDGVHAGQFRFDGGYVVAPPSVHPSGVTYQWKGRVDVPLVSPSELAIMQEPTQKGLAKDVDATQEVAGEPKKIKHSQGRGVAHPEQYAQKVIEREAAVVKSAIPGTRNSALFRAGLKTRKFCDVLSGSVVFDALVKAGIESGLPEQEARTVVLKAWNTATY